MDISRKKLLTSTPSPGIRETILSNGPKRSAARTSYRPIALHWDLCVRTPWSLKKNRNMTIIRRRRLKPLTRGQPKYSRKQSLNLWLIKLDRTRLPRCWKYCIMNGKRSRRMDYILRPSWQSIRWALTLRATFVSTWQQVSPLTKQRLRNRRKFRIR